MSTLLDHLSRWKPFTVLVVGDFMLDQLLYGNAERLCADAPVPVLHVDPLRTEHRPGGASNVCMNLAALKGRVLAFGVTGDDDHGTRLRALLRAARVETDGVVTDPERPTTVKQSLIGLAQHRHPQKMFRLDFEARTPLPERLRRALLDRFREALADADAVCIEDYDKGLLDGGVSGEVIRLCRDAGKPVLVDPAVTPAFAERYTGATVITPNRTEAHRATGGDAEPEEMARLLLERLDLEAVVLTLDRHGALLLERGGRPQAIPTVARSVYDVSGAGDMVLAALAAARANGIPWSDAVRFANAAAGLEVEVFGVHPIPLGRIHHDLIVTESATTGKLRTLQQVLVQVAAVREQGGTVVFTNGCFDVIHSGHVTLLERAAEFGTLLIVGLNDDASVRRLKGAGRPINPQDERARVLGALAAVDAVVLFAEDTPIRLIEAIRPDVLAKGADYRKEAVVGADVVERAGGRVKLIPLVEGRSTSATIRRMQRE